MDGGRAAYRGDETLACLLREAGAGVDVPAVRGLVQGVLAAPEGPDPAAWTRLVAAEPPAELETQLLALAAESGAARQGSQPGPALRLSALRAELARRGLDGFLVPHGDEHQNEFLPARAERLAWLTGFTGSAGFAAVLGERAAVFVDGRYTLQVRGQVDLALYEVRHITDSPPADWLAAHAAKGARIGHDPWLHTPDEVERYRRAVERAGAELVPVEGNPLDAVWADQPAAPVSPAVPHALAHAGRESAAKRREIGQALGTEGLAAVVLTKPESVAWLLNIRGGDVPHTPLPLSFAILAADGRCRLFMDPRKEAPGLRAHLGPEVSLEPDSDFAAALAGLAQGEGGVRADPASAPARVFDLLGAAARRGADPCVLPRAIKNETELAGARAAHLRDGMALVRFLSWLDAMAPGGAVTEQGAADRLEAFRREGALFRGLSFSTISGAGPNGAIVHYRVTPESDRPLRPGELYLVDSGGQYLDGTTDVTRTVFVPGAGTAPTAEMRDRFTRVLQGHIAVATAAFPEGTTGSQIDSLARLPLWRAGLDFDHGTGHGVGSYLGVHEGPQGISKRSVSVALRPGMIVSNEPGYYREAAYGIRIENLVAVVALPEPDGAERPLLGFEALTLAPIDLRLVDRGLLTPEEASWLDAYHARVREALSPALDATAAAWLAQAARPVAS